MKHLSQLEIFSITEDSYDCVQFTRDFLKVVKSSFQTSRMNNVSKIIFSTHSLSHRKLFKVNNNQNANRRRL